jgi:5'-nucleotidase
VLLTNDDGYAAPGLDAVARTLTREPGVRVRIVAPRDDQTGRGGATTDGPVAYERVRMPGNRTAVAVAGYPADTVRVALDDLGLRPDLVVSGINAGQNLGPLVDVSGTVGAARAAAARGLPALAVSQGLGDPPDYDAAAALLRRWVRANHGRLARWRGAVANLNVPTCTAGDVRGLVEVPPAADLGRGLEPVDCMSTAPPGSDDVGAFTVGFATLSRLTPTP